jgi:ABC-type ATPase with predicted acetyltransferase domain
MPTYSISRSLKWQGCLTDKSAAVCRMFGLTVDRLTNRCVNHRCRLEIDNGDVVYITGPSGAGKSILLREIEQAVSDADRIDLNQIELPAGKTVVDCIEGDFLTSLKILSLAGLNDVFCILNQPSNLSEGQQYRFRLAMALASKRKFIFADEFCSNLDRLTATVIAFNIHRFAKRNGTVFILASSHGDFLLDLQPDVIVKNELSGEMQVVYKDIRRRTGNG